MNDFKVYCRIPKIGFGIYGQNEFKSQIEGLFRESGINIDKEFSIEENFVYTISNDNNLLKSNVASSDCCQYFLNNRTGDLYGLFIGSIFTYQQLIYYTKNFLPGDRVRLKNYSIPTAIITEIRYSEGRFKYILNGDSSILWEFEEIEKL